MSSNHCPIRKTQATHHKSHKEHLKDQYQSARQHETNDQLHSKPQSRTRTNSRAHKRRTVSKKKDKRTEADIPPDSLHDKQSRNKVTPPHTEAQLKEREYEKCVNRMSVGGTCVGEEGRKRRLGFGKKGKSSFTVHRSEEVLPEQQQADAASGRSGRQPSSASSDGEGEGSGDGDRSEADLPFHPFVFPVLLPFPMLGRAIARLDIL